MDVLTWEGVAPLFSASIGNSVGCREKIIPFTRNGHKIEKVVIIDMIIEGIWIKISDS